MHPVCRNERRFCAWFVVSGSIALLLNPVLPQSGLGELLDVVHHAVQIPLCVDLGVSPVIEPGQALVMEDVAKHRLHGAKALAVELPAPGGVNRLAHALARVCAVYWLGLKAIDLAPPSFIGFERPPQALINECTGIAIARLGGVR